MKKVLLVIVALGVAAIFLVFLAQTYNEWAAQRLFEEDRAKLSQEIEEFMEDLREETAEIVLRGATWLSAEDHAYFVDRLQAVRDGRQPITEYEHAFEVISRSAWGHVPAGDKRPKLIKDMANVHQHCPHILFAVDRSTGRRDLEAMRKFFVQAKQDLQESMRQFRELTDQ